MPEVLTVESTVQCPHGGMVILATTNSRIQAEGAFVLIEGDIAAVVGCPFTIGPKYSPCVHVEWSSGALRTSAEKPLLTVNSIGTCYSPENAPQGVAIICNTQPKVGVQ